MSHQNSGSRGRSSRPNNHFPSRNTHVGASNPSANESVGNLDGNSLGRGRGRGRGRGKYSYNVSQGSGSKNLNDKHNSNLVYRPKRPDVISNSIEAEGMHKKQPESKYVVDLDSVYRGDHHSLSAHSDSQNIQQGVGRIKIAETPQKEAEGSATKNLYLHKEEVSYMQEESPPQPLKHPNDKNNSKSVYQPERKGVVASESVYRGGHRSLYAHSYSQNIQWAVSKTMIAETPQKEAEGSATKNLYLHKEEVTYMQEESPPQPLKHLNDKNNSKSVYQPERKGVVASESVYRGGHRSLSAHSDSQNIQQGVGRIKIAETPQKEAEGSATKNLYLHKEEVTYMQEESPPQPLKHLNDKNNSKSVYQPERKGVVASESVYRGGHRSLSAHSDSQNIQQGVGRIKIAETPQKEAEGSATKNLYLHKEEVTYMQEESPPQPLKHLNDKNNSKSVYQPGRKGVVASESISLSAHSDSQNIQQGVGRIKIAETPQKEAEGSATKNLYLHKEEVTYMQEESLQSLKVDTKGQTSEEKGSKNSTSIGDSGHSVQEAGFKPLDLCPPKKGSPFMLKPPLLVKNRQKRNEVKRATEGQIWSELRPGMVLLKNYLSFSDQVNIVKTCRDLGLGTGGFYQPGYREGASLHLKMMCLGKNWDPEKSAYEDIRSMDNVIPPMIPAEFNQLVEKAIQDSHGLIERNHKTRNAASQLPLMSPDICIVNFYSATGKLGLHQDRDETPESLKKGLPVVSFSVGNTAEFLYSDERDPENAAKVLLESGDVLIFGGKSRHIFHGVKAILPDTTTQALLEETNFRPGRLNLTFRQY